jgi:hypothetical protein
MRLILSLVGCAIFTVALLLLGGRLCKDGR